MVVETFTIVIDKMDAGYLHCLPSFFDSSGAAARWRLCAAYAAAAGWRHLCAGYAAIMTTI